MKRAENSPKKNEEIKSILISQPEPTTGRSPYFDLAEKLNLQIDFCPFIRVEGLSGNEFLKQKVDITERTAVIFTSRHAIDHFFRVCKELKIDVSSELKYFCIRKTVALHLKRYVQYRKRKIFFPEGGRTAGLLEILKRYKKKERFLVPCSEQSKDDIPKWLRKNRADYKKAILYQTVSNDVKEIVNRGYDMIVFFSPKGVKSLLENFPDYEQKNTRIAAFGSSTSKAVLDAGLQLDVQAPSPEVPSMTAAIELFIKEN